MIQHYRSPRPKSVICLLLIGLNQEGKGRKGRNGRGYRREGSKEIKGRGFLVNALVQADANSRCQQGDKTVRTPPTRLLASSWSSPHSFLEKTIKNKQLKLYCYFGGAPLCGLRSYVFTRFAFRSTNDPGSCAPVSKSHLTREKQPCHRGFPIFRS